MEFAGPLLVTLDAGVDPLRQFSYLFGMRGTCALCLTDGQISKSHLIPQWAYDRVLDFTDYDLDPVTIRDGRAKSSSLQIWKYLLCPACENRLSKHEDVAARCACAKDGSSQLTALPLLGGSARLGVDVVSARDISYDAMIRFGLGLVWKCGVSKLKDSQCKLGQKYEAILQQYLLEAIPLPQSVVVVLAVMRPDPGSSYHVASLFPVTDRVGTCHRTRVLVCGLHYDVYLGQQIDPRLAETSISHNPDRPIAVVPASNMAFLNKAKPVILRSTPTRKPAATGAWGDE